MDAFLFKGFSLGFNKGTEQVMIWRQKKKKKSEIDVNLFCISIRPGMVLILDRQGLSLAGVLFGKMLFGGVASDGIRIRNCRMNNQLRI